MRKFLVIGTAVALMFAGAGSALAKPPAGGGGGGGGAGGGAKQTIISLAANTLSVAEGSTGNLVITRGGNKTCGTTVSYTTTNGTAEVGDYSLAPGTPVTWAANETVGSKNVVVSGLSDADIANETFTFKITAAPSSNTCSVKVVVQNPTQSVVTIVDGDDPDGDGIASASDNCPAISNSDQADLDSDGLGDVCDSDIDADGDDNASDNCPTTANPDQADLDSDGLGDVCDSDIDGDGHDNASDAFPTNPLEWADTDSDTVGDNSDNCPAVANAGQEDIDGGGAGDACDGDNFLAGTSTGGESGVDGTFTGTIINSLGYPDGSYSGTFGGTNDDASGVCGGVGFYIGGTVTLTFGGDSADVTLDNANSYFCETGPDAYNAHWQGTVLSGGGAFATGAGGSVSYDGTTTARDVNQLRTDAGGWSGDITVS